MMWFGRAKDASRGQSLIEILIGVTIAAIIVGSVVGALILSVRTNKQSITSKTASSLGQGLIDQVRSITEGDWSKLYYVGDKGPDTNYFLFSEDTIQTTDELDAAGIFPALAIDFVNNPVLAYYAKSGDLKVVHCNDSGCLDGDESIQTVEPGGFYNSMELDSNGYPVIAHYDDVGQDFYVVHCNDPNCSGGDESSELITARVSGLSLELDGSGNPVVSYQKVQGHNLTLLHCNDPNCAGGR